MRKYGVRIVFKIGNALFLNYVYIIFYNIFYLKKYIYFYYIFYLKKLREIDTKNEW